MGCGHAVNVLPVRTPDQARLLTPKGFRAVNVPDLLHRWDWILGTG